MASSDYRHLLEGRPKGYVTSIANDMLDGLYLTYGTKNMVIADDGTLETVKGKTLFGQIGDDPNLFDGLPYTNNKVVWADTWSDSRGRSFPIRCVHLKYAGTSHYIIQVYIQEVNEWVKINAQYQSIPNAITTGASWYDKSLNKDRYIMGTRGAYMQVWNGGVAQAWYGTSNTLTKLGSSTWSEVGFLDPVYKNFVLDGVTYSYTGGENTTTLTGITPALPTIVSGTLATSVIISHGNTGLPAGFNTEIVATFKNQLYVGDSTRRDMYVSKNTAFNDFTFTVPVRMAGEGATAVLDANIKAIHVDDNGKLIVSAGTSYYYDLNFKEVSVSNGTSAIYGEILVVNRAKIAYGQGVLNANAITNAKNGTIIITADKSVDYLSKVAVSNDSTTESMPISAPIQTDLDRLDLTGAMVRYFKGHIILQIPAHDIWYMYNILGGFWNPPRTSNHTFLSIYNDALLAHANYTDESFLCFSGINDYDSRGTGYQIIENQIVYSYKNAGIRDTQKLVNSFFIEAKIVDIPYTGDGNNGIITLSVDKGFQASKGIENHTFGLNDEAKHIDTPNFYIKDTIEPVNPMYYNSGSRMFMTDRDAFFLKYKRVFPLNIEGEEVYEYRARLSVSQRNFRMKILSVGFAQIESGTHNNNLIKGQ